MPLTQAEIDEQARIDDLNRRDTPDNRTEAQRRADGKQLPLPPTDAERQANANRNRPDVDVSKTHGDNRRVSVLKLKEINDLIIELKTAVSRNDRKSIDATIVSMENAYKEL